MTELQDVMSLETFLTIWLIITVMPAVWGVERQIEKRLKEGSTDDQ